jgi:hypothetical protein
MSKGSELLGQAAQTFSQQDRVVKQKAPGKTIGGAITSAAAMGGTGAMIGAAIAPTAAAATGAAAGVGTAAATGAAAGSIVPGPGTLIGLGIGAAVGLAGYMLS